MKLLILSDSISYTIVDDEDFERLSKFIWCISGHTIRRYSSKGTKTVSIPIANEILRRHDCMFDHIDRDWKNNQKVNLREATQHQNAINRSKLKGTTSKYKGVYWCNKRCKWIAQIKNNRIAKNLGGYTTQEEAALAYNEAAKTTFGNFAVLNVITNSDN